MNRNQIREIQEYIENKANKENKENKENNKEIDNKTERDLYEKWKQSWYDAVPKCKDFICSHELMSCGIDTLCGYCTIYETWRKNKPNAYICTTIDCMDCEMKYECKKVRYEE